MSPKKLKPWFALVFAFAWAIVWFSTVKYILFYNPLLPLQSVPDDIDSWLEGVYALTNTIGAASGVLLLFTWLVIALTSRFTQSIAVYSKRLFWWLLAIGYYLFNLIVFLTISFTSGWIDDPQYLEFLLWYPLTMFADVIFIFWLPTTLGTPNSMRYVPPFAMFFRKLYGA